MVQREAADDRWEEQQQQRRRWQEYQQQQRNKTEEYADMQLEGEAENRVSQGGQKTRVALNISTLKYTGRLYPNLIERKECGRAFGVATTDGD